MIFIHQGQPAVIRYIRLARDFRFDFSIKIFKNIMKVVNGIGHALSKVLLPVELYLRNFVLYFASMQNGLPIAHNPQHFADDTI